MSEPRSEERSCPRCGVTIADAAPAGLCPRCLLGQAGVRLGSSSGGDLPVEIPDASELDVLLEGYEVRRLIGRGGMGAVYEARQETLDRMVAIKLLPAEVSGDVEFADRFAREARAMARLNHSNIVSVYDFGQSDAYVFFVMELVDGEDLASRMKPETGRPIPADEAVRVVSQVCAALSYAHDCGVIHRDIKPANLLLREDGVVKITDFGLAKVVEGSEGGDFSLTLTEERMGTPQYSPPELLKGAGGADERSDLYSLGVVFYEMLTRKLPMGNFRPASELAGTPRWMDRVLKKVLASDPDERFQTGEEMACALNRGPAVVPRWALVAALVAVFVLIVLQGTGGSGAGENGDGEPRVAVAAEEQGIAETVKKVRVVYDEVETMSLAITRVGFGREESGEPWARIETGRDPSTGTVRRISAKAAGGAHGDGGWTVTAMADPSGQLRFLMWGEGSLQFDEAERDEAGRVKVSEWRYYFRESGEVAGGVVKYFMALERSSLPEAAEAATNKVFEVGDFGGARVIEAAYRLAEVEHGEHVEAAVEQMLWAHRCAEEPDVPLDRESYAEVELAGERVPGGKDAGGAALVWLRQAGLIGEDEIGRVLQAEDLGKREDGFTQLVLVTEDGVNGLTGSRFLVELLSEAGSGEWTVAWVGRQARAAGVGGERPWVLMR